MTVDFNFPAGFGGQVKTVKEGDNSSLVLPAACQFAPAADDATVTTMSVKIGPIDTGSTTDPGCINDQFVLTDDPEVTIIPTLVKRTKLFPA